MFTRLLGEVTGIFNKITIMELLVSIIYIVLGLVFFIFPNLSNLLVSIITGVFLICTGGISLMAFFKRGGIELFNYNLMYGLIFIVIGIVAFFLGNVLSIIIGIFLIIQGVQKVTYGLCLKKYNETSWLLTLVIGILYFVIALLAFFTNGEIVKVVGVLLFGNGFINFINTILLRRRSKYFLG